MCFLDVDIILDEGGQSGVTKYNDECDKESESEKWLKFDN